MLKLFKSNRCQICYTERMVRECPRKKKKICWQCCNALRSDSKCPGECPYAPKKLEGSPFPGYKADSRSESQDAIKLHIDLWIGRTQDSLEGQTPAAFAKTNPGEMLAWLSGYQYPLGFPLDYLMEKLNLKHEPAEVEPDPEDCVEGFVSALIRLDWQSLRGYSINSSSLPDVAERYTELMQTIPGFGKISTYSVLHSGLGEDGTSAIVYVEFNHRQDWTFVLSNRSGKWKIRQNLNGNPQLFFTQNKAYAEIAEALGKGDDATVWELLESSFKLYPDSADLYYYRAIYWQLVKQPEKATVDFFNAIAVDNAWPEPYFHLGAIYLGKQDYQQAAMWFAELVDLQPDNPNAQNNLAAAFAGGGEQEKAREIWQKLVKQYPGFELAAMNLEKLK